MVETLNPVEQDVVYLSVNISNLIVGFIAVIIFIEYIKRGTHKRNILPRSLRYYLNTCFFPFVILFTIQSIYVSFSYLLYRDPTRFDYKLIRLSLTFTSNQLRLSLLTTVIERTIATIYLEKYGKYSGSITLYFILCFSSFFLSAAYFTSNMLWIFDESNQFGYLVTVYLLIVIHIFTLIICRILHVKSQKMYKLLAYRVSLRRRHQIVVNIKILTFLWPFILIFSALGPIGPFMVWLYHVITRNESPFGILQTSYNATFIIMMIFRMKYIYKRDEHLAYQDGLRMRIMSVTSPLGQILPTSISPEIYFQELKKQWS